MTKNSIHWFRKGLRLHDNPALLEAVRDSDTVRCVYFLDPWFAGSSNLGVNRWRWGTTTVTIHPSTNQSIRFYCPSRFKLIVHARNAYVLLPWIQFNGYYRVGEVGWVELCSVWIQEVNWKSNSRFCTNLYWKSMTLNCPRPRCSSGYSIVVVLRTAPFTQLPISGLAKEDGSMEWWDVPAESLDPDIIR